MSRASLGARARRGPLLTLAAMAAVVVAGTVTVLGFAAAAGTSPWLVLPLAVIGALAVPAAGHELAVARREEIGLARLRGVHGARLVVFLLAEPLTAILLGAVAGVALGVAGTWLATWLWLDAPEVALSGSTPAAVGGRGGRRTARGVRRHGVGALGAALGPGQHRDPHPTRLDRGDLRQRADHRGRGDRGLPQRPRHRPGLGGARRAGAGRPGRRPGHGLAAPRGVPDRHGPDREQRDAGLPGHPAGGPDRRRWLGAAAAGRRRRGRHPGRDRSGRRGRVGRRVREDHGRCSPARRPPRHGPGGAGQDGAARPRRSLPDGRRPRPRRPTRPPPRVRRHQPLRRRDRRLLRRHRRRLRGRRRGGPGRGPPAARDRETSCPRRRRRSRSGCRGRRRARSARPRSASTTSPPRVARPGRPPAPGRARRHRRGLGTARAVRPGLRRPRDSSSRRACSSATTSSSSATTA